ncbi:hypothetical protein L3Q82_026272 [Scortum barcoo]|uniref:Uncharacterized protein n=1 Tax=Scortum barcoo TaxID=214431 RepID=A0ACB8WHU6_9TELE|nr:hypothetical protein L3Q82_026272 [Scortum barcoo]
MSYASERLYKGYLRTKMPTIVTKVKVREIVVHLPCLTDHDRETIEAKREVCGNYDSMVHLLDCLKRRENWVDQFINALEACDHQTIAAEIRAEYDALRGTNNSNPSSPPTTVVRAHVHPAPSAGHLSIPESGGNNQAAVSLPDEASAPPEPAARASPPPQIPTQPQAPQSSAAQVPEAVSPPEPVAEPPQPAHIAVAPPPSTPPSSPEAPHTRVTPPPQNEINSHREPGENSESDIQDISGDNGAIPDRVSAGNGEVSINSVATPPPSRSAEQSETDLLTTTTSTAEVRPPSPQSPFPVQINPDVTNGSSLTFMTPEKPPVQDTTPPVDLKPAAALQPEETFEPPAAQIVESSPQTETAATNSPPPGAAGMDASLYDDDTLCLSKPGQLISVHPQSDSNTTILAPSSPVEPYSGNSDRLEISDPAATSAHVPACSAVSSTTVNTASALPCQENGISLSHNQPEENHYESPTQSLLMQEVREHVGHVSEEVSILNMDGQNATPEAQIVNRGAAKEPCAAEAVSSVNSPSSENHCPSEPAPADLSPEKEKASHTSSANTKYIFTAAGVVACALLMAWKFKN